MNPITPTIRERKRRDEEGGREGEKEREISKGELGGEEGELFMVVSDIATPLSSSPANKKNSGR